MEQIEMGPPGPVRYIVGAAVMMVGIVLPVGYMMFRTKRVPNSSGYAKQTQVEMKRSKETRCMVICGLNRTVARHSKDPSRSMKREIMSLIDWGGCEGPCETFGLISALILCSGGTVFRGGSKRIGSWTAKWKSNVPRCQVQVDTVRALDNRQPQDQVGGRRAGYNFTRDSSSLNVPCSRRLCILVEWKIQQVFEARRRHCDPSPSCKFS